MVGTGETRSNRTSPVSVLPCLPEERSSASTTSSTTATTDKFTTCHMCRAVSSLRTEWSQGDLVCTSCGIVHAERVIDSGPEWRDYGDNDDSGNAGNRARCGMIATDESKYVGGLQPTTVSRVCFGSTSYGGRGRATGGYSHTGSIAQRLWKANVRVDRLMEQRHKDAFTNAALNLKLLRKRQQQQKQQQQQQIQSSVEQHDAMTTDDTDCTVHTNADTAVTNDDVEPDYGKSVVWMEERPEFEQQLLEQEELVARQRQALFADKWSLERAKQWHATNDTTAIDTTTPSGTTEFTSNKSRVKKSSYLNASDEKVLGTAARDLYTCYQMLVRAGATLDLPTTISDEAAALLCQYAARRDGLKVKGVAVATVPLAASATPSWSKASARPVRVRAMKRGAMDRTKDIRPTEVNEQQQIVRDANKQRQMRALCAALLFWTARHRQRPRSLVAVCDSIPDKVQRKHCSRAMNDLKEYFPELATMSNTSTTMMLTNSTTRSHQPMMAVPHAISVQTHVYNDETNDDDIIVHSEVATATATAASLSSKEATSVANFTEHAVKKLNLPPVAEASIRFLVLHHLENSDESGKVTSLRTVCAALTYFVCRAGDIMQQLAAQSQAETKKNAAKRVSEGPISKSRMYKQAKLDSKVASQTDFSLDLFADSTSTGSSTKHLAASSTVLVEQRAYEMRRMWDAWAEQMPWSRTLVQIEQSTGVSRNAMLDYFKQKLFPKRKILLTELCKAGCDSTTPDDTRQTTAPCSLVHQIEIAVLKGTPLASVLLPHLTVAMMLMKDDERC